MSLVEWEPDQGMKIQAFVMSSLFASSPPTLAITKVQLDAPKSKEELGLQ